MWWANGNPCIDLNEILQAHLHLPKEGFGASLTPRPLSRLGLGGLKPFKLKATF